VVLIGASMGGTASLLAASEDRVAADVVVTLSAPASEGMDLTDARRSLRQAVHRGQRRRVSAEDAQSLYANPRLVEVITDDHALLS
jgi:pimeloyl-ACP methyl ester carboxylesterase